MPVAAQLYRAVWRWHFYAGLCVLPIVLVLALSGLAMLASEPLDRWLHSDVLRVTPAGEPLAASRQTAAVAAAYPDADIATFSAGLAADESTRIAVLPKHANGAHGAHGAAGPSTASPLNVYVHPYTGAVLGQIDENRTLYAWAKKLHGTLLLGIVGDYLIEIAAGFAVLLVATGAYLWWPRNGRSLKQALVPAVGGAGRRRWRNVHAALGLWVAPILLFFLLSGLAWTPFWGGKLVQTWSSLPGEAFDAPLADTTHASLGHGAHRDAPWAVEQTPLPASGSGLGAPGIRAATIGLDEVIDYARAAGFAQFRVHFPRGERGVWTVASTTIAGDTRELNGDRILHLDAATGNVLADIRFAHYSPMGKLMAAGIPLHQADLGPLNLAVNVLFCLAMIGMGAAALAAWWVRRPSGVRRLVPPPLPQDAVVLRMAVAVMLALSLAFPLVAVTIAVVLAVDWLLLERLRAARLIFE